jgi:hypothetical protein
MSLVLANREARVGVYAPQAEIAPEMLGCVLDVGWVGMRSQEGEGGRDAIRLFGSWVPQTNRPHICDVKGDVLGGAADPSAVLASRNAFRRFVEICRPVRHHPTCTPTPGPPQVRSFPTNAMPPLKDFETLIWPLSAMIAPIIIAGVLHFFVGFITKNLWSRP